MIFKDKTVFTSERLDPPGDGTLQLHVTGPGPVAIEFLGEDGDYRSFPESRFTGPTAQMVNVPNAFFRVVISAGPTTVEIFK